MRLVDKQYAISLRKKGMSYNEIRSRIPKLSKGTLSHWLTKALLTEQERKNLTDRMQVRKQTGLVKARATIITQKKNRLLDVSVFAKKLFIRNQHNPFFIGGLILYWAEGAKTTEHIQFMNSDPRLIVYMVRWFRKFLQIPIAKIRLRLFIHKIYAHEQHEIFWKKLIPFPPEQFLKTIYKPTPHTLKKNPDYKGCMRVDAGGVNQFYMLEFFKEMFSKKYVLQAPVV